MPGMRTINECGTVKGEEHTNFSFTQSKMRKSHAPNPPPIQRKHVRPPATPPRRTPTYTP